MHCNLQLQIIQESFKIISFLQAQSINIFKSSQGLFLRILQQTGEMVSHRWNEKTEQFEKSESKTMQLGNVKDSDTSVQSENSLSVRHII